jgi:hypothetical protein
MDDETEPREDIAALSQAHDLDLPPERVAKLAGPRRGQRRIARALRAAVRLTDEPAHIFVPQHVERLRGDTGHADG